MNQFIQTLYEILSSIELYYITLSYTELMHHFITRAGPSFIIYYNHILFSKQVQTEQHSYSQNFMLPTVKQYLQA